ncbi:MAG TPA: GNAT family N-acetyltransferase [Chloroflexia bacterium]|nr:GNAT family N-acetyltransferase [Chloroflexia bacterium]
MEIEIRPCTPDDYEAIAAVANAACIDANGQAVATLRAAGLREADATRDARCRFARWVALQAGRVAGFGEYDQAAHRYHPQKFWIDVYVHPDCQHQGIGGALYDRVVAGLQAFDPLSARCGVREDLAPSLRFLEHRGWQEAARIWESVLDLATCDPAPLAGGAERAAAAGITITTYPALAGDPQCDQKLYELVWEIRQDLPDLDAPTKEAYDYFVAQRLQHADMVPDAFFIATDQDRYVGYIYHHRDEADPEQLHIAQLGVARAYRSRGIARALKMHGVAFAQAHGYRRLHTTNESGNRHVLTINEQLGFVRRPAWLDMVKTWGPR